MPWNHIRNLKTFKDFQGNGENPENFILLFTTIF